MSLMPELEFSGLLSVVPLVNIVLLARDLVEGHVDGTLATIAVLSTVLYALAAIALAARIFGTDAILYGSEASWSDLLLRSRQPRNTSSASAAMFAWPCSSRCTSWSRIRWLVGRPWPRETD